MQKMCYNVFMKTIVALATPAGNSGVAVIRISGEKSKEVLQKLSEVKEWAQPTQKGRFAFDEKKFYQSISRQFSDGKTLSAKQIAALDKLAAKYLN